MKVGAKIVCFDCGALYRRQGPSLRCGNCVAKYGSAYAHVPHVDNGHLELDAAEVEANRELWAPARDESALDEHSLRQLTAVMEFLLHSLSGKEEVLRRRFGIGYDEHTLDETGAVMQNENAGKLGITRERIRQIEAKALRKLRHPSRSKWIAPFIDADRVPLLRGAPPNESEEWARPMPSSRPQPQPQPPPAVFSIWLRCNAGCGSSVEHVGADRNRTTTAAARYSRQEWNSEPVPVVDHTGGASELRAPCGECRRRGLTAWPEWRAA